MRRSYIPITIVAAALMALLGLACSVTFDKSPEDTDFKINIRDVPKQAHEAKLEIYDLNYLRTQRLKVTSVEEKRIGTEVEDYYVANDDGNSIQPQQTEIVPVEGGSLNRTMYITTDHLGDLFLHLVMLDKDEKPYSHVCSCRKMALKIKEGQVLTMPGKSYVENPDLHKSLCKALEIDDCFSCEDLYDDNNNLVKDSVNLPCWLSNIVEDGDDDGEVGEDIETDGSDVENGDVTDEIDNDTTDPDTTDAEVEQEEEVLPIGQYFYWEAEDKINADESQPAADVKIYDGTSATFYRDIVVLGGDASTAAGLQDGDFLRFDFIVDYPGLYMMKVMPVLASFHGKAKFFIDGVELNSSIFDIDMFNPCEPPSCDAALFSFMRPGDFNTVTESVFLSIGEHTLTVVVAGRNGSSTGKGIGIDHVKFLPAE